MRKLEKYLEDLNKLIKTGEEIVSDFIRNKESENKLDTHYQHWYSESLEVIRIILPSRLAEFEELYDIKSKQKDDLFNTYAIKNWLLGMRAKIKGKEVAFQDYRAVLGRLRMQVEILKSAETRFVSSLFDIKEVLRADLFDSELESARELLQKGFLRASGVMAGVVAEKHLGGVCAKHGIKVKKKDPGISAYNDELKNNKIIEISDWRFIQRIGDLRNLCAHKKERANTR